jgi:hypothetical protein
MKIQEKFDLTGRVAVVTGGVGLLGTEFCRTLAEAGAAVAVVDLNAEKCAAVAADLTKAGYKALGVATDITSPDSVNTMVEKVVSTLGRIDVLVNSAALDPKFDPEAVSKGIAPGKFEEYPLEQWNAALNLWIERPRPAHLPQTGWLPARLQTDLLHRDQSWDCRFYQILGRLLHGDGYPRQHADTWRRVQ